MKKKLFALLVCAMLFTALFTATAFAEDCTVMFNTLGHGSLATVTVESGGMLPANLKPTGDDGTKCFHGWLLNGSPFDLTATPVTESITLTADWRDHTNAKTTSDSCTDDQVFKLTCSYCGKEYTVTLPHRDHNLASVEAQAATCTEAGWNAYQYCTYENCSYTTKTEIPALDHHLVDVPQQDATCVEDGWKAYKKCDRDGCDYKEGFEAISATGVHTWTNTVAEEYLKQAATCCAPAAYHQSCSVCGAKSENTFFTSGTATGVHNYVNNVCTTPGCTAKRASVTVTIQGAGSGTLNGEPIVSGQTVYLTDGEKVSINLTAEAGSELTDILENGQARSSISMPYEYNAVAGTPDFAVKAIFSPISSKTVAEPRKQLQTSGDAVTKAETLKTQVAAANKITDASLIKCAVYDVTPVWSDGTAMTAADIASNGPISFTLPAPGGTSATNYQFVVYHFNGTSYDAVPVSNSLTVTTSSFSEFAAYAVPLTSSTVVVTTKTTPAAPTVTAIHRIDDGGTRAGGLVVQNPAYPLEYMKDGSAAGYITMSGGAVSGLTAGKYYVRYAATATTYASAATPVVIDDYYTVSSKLLYGKGTYYADASEYAGQTGVYLVKKGSSITYHFTPADHYWLYTIYVNDVYVGQSNVKTTYTLKNVNEKTLVSFGFSATSSSPKTADESNVGLWAVVGVVSAAALAGIVVYLVKKRK